MVCQSGHDVTKAVPVISGVAYTATVKKNNVAGRVITDHLLNLVNPKIGPGNWMADENHYKNIYSMKTELCFVSLDPEADIALAKESYDLKVEHELPDGQVITLD